jgi:hypothetical protein
MTQRASLNVIGILLFGVRTLTADTVIGGQVGNASEASVAFGPGSLVLLGIALLVIGGVLKRLRSHFS